MASLAARDYFQLQFDSYRLTSDRLNYYVLCAILTTSVSRGRPDTGRITYENLQVRAAEFDQAEARVYGNPLPAMDPLAAVVGEVQDLLARELIEIDSPSEKYIIVTPLIDTWGSMKSVRYGRDGKLLRSQL